MPPLMTIVSCGNSRFEPIHALIVERRNLAVFLRTQSLQPRLARVDDQHAQSGRDLHFDEALQIVVVILIVDADAAFHRHGDISSRISDRRAHRRDTIGDERRFAHQARAEASGLHAIRRTTDVEIDFVITHLRADARGSGQIDRIGTAELQADGMFRRVEPEQPFAIAVQRGAGRHHLGIQTRVRREQAMEMTAMAVRPVHHRRDAYAPRLDFFRLA